MLVVGVEVVAGAAVLCSGELGLSLALPAAAMVAPDTMPGTITWTIATINSCDC